MWSMAPVEYLIIFSSLLTLQNLCMIFLVLLFVFLAYTCTSGNSYQIFEIIASKMASPSSIESSDRALQVSSGNLGESLQTNVGIAKRSRSLLQQRLFQAVDDGDPVADEVFRPKQRMLQRRSNQFQTPKRASSELPNTYRCEFNSPRYVEYREKQNKHKNAKGRQQVWTDSVEEAFHDGTFELCSSSHKYPCLMCCQPYGILKIKDAKNVHLTAWTWGRMN